MRLGELIAIARECKGWTLRDLERVAGVSNALLSQIETGKVKDPGFSTVVRITDALGISIERAAKTARPPISGYSPEVYDSCGCVFCDLGLDPNIEIEGVKFHHVPRRGNILCERKSSVAAES